METRVSSSQHGQSGTDKRTAADGTWRGVVQAALEKDVERVKAAIPGVSFDEEVERFRWPIQVKRWLWHDKYLKGLAAYCRTFSVKSALELGTESTVRARAVPQPKEQPRRTDFEQFGRVLRARVAERLPDG